jgi:FkbM family methyltransferase
MISKFWKRKGRFSPNLSVDEKIGISVAPAPPPPDLWSWLVQYRPITTLIDIGANDGAFGEFISGFLHVNRCYAFEPQARLQAQIEKRLAHVRHKRVFPLALSDIEGTADFFENSNHPSSSLLRVSEHSKREFPQTSGEIPTKVRLALLDDVLTDEDLGSDVFIKIDVQGVEDKVIRGGRRVFGRAKFVMIEMSFVPFYDGQPLFEEVHEMLFSLGLRFAGLKNQINSPQTGQPLFAHCLYRRH